MAGDIEKRVDDLERRVQNLEDFQAQTARSVLDMRRMLERQGKRLDKVDERMAGFQQFLQDHSMMLVGEFIKLETSVKKIVQDGGCKINE